MGNLNITLETDENSPKINHINKLENTPDRELTTLKRKFHKLFTENHPVKNVAVEFQLEEGPKRTKQSGRPIPIHLQPAVGKEIEKLEKRRHIEKAYLFS